VNWVTWALQHANYVTLISLTFTDIHDLRNKLNGYKNRAGQQSDYFIALRFSHASEPGNNHFRSDRLPCDGRLYGHPITGLSTITQLQLTREWRRVSELRVSIELNLLL